MPIVPFHLDQKTQFSKVYAEDGDPAWSAEVSGTQHASVPAGHDQHVKLATPDPFAEHSIVQGTKWGVYSFVLKISGHCIHFGKRLRHLWISSYNRSLWDEGIRHSEVIIRDTGIHVHIADRLPDLGNNYRSALPD